MSPSSEVEAFFAEHSARLYGHLRRRGADAELASDIVQDSFLALLVRWQRSKPDDPVPYLYKVAHNVLASKVKKRCAAPQELLSENSQVSEDNVGRSDIRLDFAAAIKRLPARQRRVIELYYLANEPIRAIARLLNVTQATVKVHLHAARKRLRPWLAGYDTKEGEAG